MFIPPPSHRRLIGSATHISEDDLMYNIFKLMTFPLLLSLVSPDENKYKNK